MIKIWERYFYKEIIKYFFFFLFVFYGLYILIDYSSHASSFHHGHSHFKLIDIAKYYLFDFIQKMEILISFGLLLATIRTLTNFNSHNELIALLASGINIRKLLKPFIVLGLLMVALMYVNTQYWMPYAMEQTNHIDQKHRKEKNKLNKITAVQNIVLKDGSTILFQNYDMLDKALVDVYWVRSIDNIYRIQTLYPYANPPLGKQVEELKRGNQGQLKFLGSHDELSFQDMRFHKKDLFQGIIDPEDLSLTALWRKMPEYNKATNEKEAQVVSAFYHKMLMPWLCLLAVIAPAPFCVRFSRNIPLFFIYALGLFGLVAFYLVTDATLILGKRQIFDPVFAILVPFFCLSALLSYKYVRLK